MIVSPAGSLMRQIVDDILAGGADMQIVAEVAHRTSILPLVLQGVGLAVLPSAWAPLARRAGARTARLDPTAQLHIALLSRAAPLTPAARRSSPPPAPTSRSTTSRPDHRRSEQPK